MNCKELNIFSGSLETDISGSILNKEALIGKWEIDPDDGQSVQFRIPSQSFGGDNDRIGFYASASGEIGIGTKDPESAFDIRDNSEDVDAKDRTAKTKLFNISKKSQKFDQPVTGSIVSAAVLAAKATILETARTLGGVSFNGSANINLPGVNAAGNQATTGNAATATNLASFAFATDRSNNLVITSADGRTTWTIAPD